MIAYEDAKGYKSFGRLSEEFYNSIDIESFSSFEEIKDFVNEHCNFLQLTKDENGEFELDTKFYKNAERYLMNKHHMFQVGDSLYKIFETGIAIISCNENEIIDIQEKDIEYFKQKETCRFVNNTLLEQKSLSSDCGTSHVWRSTNGNKRLKVVIKLTKPFFEVKCHFLSRPYKRTLYVWYQCGRTMKADVNLFFAYKYDTGVINNDIERFETRYGNLHFQHDWEGNSKYEAFAQRNTNFFKSKNQFWFTSYDVWVDTYDVSKIDESCN